MDANDKFVLNPEALAYLRTLHGRVAVVAIAGIYRTGKSYLLNQLMGKSSAFAVGPTVKATTKGIWIWGRAIPSADGSDTHVLFMDTEGLGSTVRSETYDARIFALALLLSSFFIYNSFGTIDGNAIANLSLVVHLTKHIRVRASAATSGGGSSSSGDSASELNSFFPNFLWVVRDFGVKLESGGRKITSREYLENALKPEEGDESTDQTNAVRTLIRSFFPERDCGECVGVVLTGSVRGASAECVFVCVCACMFDPSHEKECMNVCVVCTLFIHPHSPHPPRIYIHPPTHPPTRSDHGAPRQRRARVDEPERRAAGGPAA